MAAFISESVAAFRRNGWPTCVGISGRLGSEYADRLQFSAALLLAHQERRINQTFPNYPHALLVDSETPEITEALLEAGADANSEEGASYGTALHEAARHGRIAQIKLLISRSARLNSIDSSNRTPLHYAVGGLSYNDTIYIEAVKLLLSAGVNVNATNRDGITPLHYASKSDRVEAAAAARLLIGARADINAKDRNGDVPLHYLAGREEGKHPAAKEIAELLIANGADINVTNNKSNTPLAVAINAKNITIARLLRSHGAKEQ